MVRLFALSMSLVVLLAGCMEGEKSNPEKRDSGKSLDDGSRSVGDPKVDAARAALKQLTTAVETFHVKFGTPPQTLHELVKPAEGPPLVKPEALLDPWGKPYQYAPEGAQNQGMRPDIWTIGPDKELIGNWPAKK